MLVLVLNDLGDFKLLLLSSLLSEAACFLVSQLGVSLVVVGHCGECPGLGLGLEANKHPTADLLWVAGEATGDPTGVLELGYIKFLCLGMVSLNEAPG